MRLIFANYQNVVDYLSLPPPMPACFQYNFTNLETIKASRKKAKIGNQ